MLACRKRFSTSHVLIILLKNWKKALDNKFVHMSCSYRSLKGVWLYFSRSYGFDTVTMVYSYLKEKKKKRVYQQHLQHSASNTFRCTRRINFRFRPVWYILSDLLFWLKRSKIHNFADDKTISAPCKSLQQLTGTLEQESKSAVLWFRWYEMIVNPNKFQAILLKNVSKTKVNLNICNENANITP